MGLMGPRTRRLPWARGPSPFGRWGPPGWPLIWRRWGSGANSSSISTWGRSRGNKNCRSNNGCSSSRHGRRTLASGGGGSGCRDDGDRIRAGVGPSSRGRRRATHLGPVAVPSARLNHA